MRDVECGNGERSAKVRKGWQGTNESEAMRRVVSDEVWRDKSGCPCIRT